MSCLQTLITGALRSLTRGCALHSGENYQDIRKLVEISALLLTSCVTQDNLPNLERVLITSTKQLSPQVDLNIIIYVRYLIHKKCLASFLLKGEILKRIPLLKLFVVDALVCCPDSLCQEQDLLSKPPGILCKERKSFVHYRDCSGHRSCCPRPSECPPLQCPTQRTSIPDQNWSQDCLGPLPKPLISWALMGFSTFLPSVSLSRVLSSEIQLSSYILYSLVTGEPALGTQESQRKSKQALRLST